MKIGDALRRKLLECGLVEKIPIDVDKMRVLFRKCGFKERPAVGGKMTFLRTKKDSPVFSCVAILSA